MRMVFKLIFIVNFVLASSALYANPKPGDSVNISIDSMDRLYNKLQKQNEELKTKIDEAGEKIEAAKNANNKKTNYWIPVAGGAVLGIGLAWWLRKRRKKQ